MMRTRTTTRDAVDDRLAIVSELITTGLSAEESESWCSAWEGEAERQHVQSDSPYFWDAGRGWIDATRSLPALAPPARQALGLPAFSIVRT